MTDPKPHESSLGELLRERQVIPRWKSPSQAAQDGERKSATDSRQEGAQKPDWMKRLVGEHARNPTLYTANELHETAFVLGLTTTQTYHVDPTSKLSGARAQEVLREKPILDSGVENANFVDEKRQITGKKIRELKQRLNQYPKQTIVWSELSRHYLINGQNDKAKKAMECALKLGGKNNRYLARSACRMFMHLGDEERALNVLRQQEGLKHDPWLLSAEIAVSDTAGKASKLIKIGQAMVGLRSQDSSQISELAAAIGTIENQHGKRRSADEYFRKSLISPTENSLAQAQWASNNQAKIAIPDSAWEIPKTFEADTLAARADRRWDAVLQSAGHWLRDEPFSLLPAAIGSYASFTDAQCRISEQFASAGLSSSPSSAFLLNNRAVSRSYLGNIRGAYQDIKLALESPNARTDPHLLATIGLVAYRSGYLNLGAKCYMETLSCFVARKDRASVTLAALYWLREQVRLGLIGVDKELEAIRKICRFPEPSREPEILTLLEVVENDMSSRFGAAVTDGHILLPHDRPVSSELSYLAERIEKPEPQFDISDNAHGLIETAYNMTGNDYLFGISN